MGIDKPVGVLDNLNNLARQTPTSSAPPSHKHESNNIDGEASVRPKSIGLEAEISAQPIQQTKEAETARISHRNEKIRANHCSIREIWMFCSRAVQCSALL